ncbi:hypothetical protein [Aggregatimonas sangjinii]|nr:hypothetical protein [Aggregatimonas sangjinii]
MQNQTYTYLTAMTPMKKSIKMSGAMLISLSRKSTQLQYIE